MIHVVAGVVIDAKDRVLIAQRPPGKRLAGGWEFPGGKLEAGEDRVVGLARELKEEIGVMIGPLPRPLLRLMHTYDYGQILLDVFIVQNFTGEASGLDNQRLRWCSREELEQVVLLPADRPIVRALALPERLQSQSGSGYRVVPAERIGGDLPVGTHLLGAYCESPADGVKAVERGADFIVMRRALTEVELRQLCHLVSVPVFAAGVSLPDAFRHGASGITEISEICSAIC